MNYVYTKEDLDYFLSNIYFTEISANDGGMQINDMFSFYFLLKTLRPSTIIESGCWNGLSTKLIRRTLGKDCKIICLDPRDIPENGFHDDNPNTIYFTGKLFNDFENLNIDNLNKQTTLCFFDDHQNSAQRLEQCIKKGFKHIFLNDNYPVNAGSHFTIQHLIDKDERKVFDINNQYNYSINVLPQIDLNRRDELLGYIVTYIVFPNIFLSKIVLYEGVFDSIGFLDINDKNNIEKYKLFYDSRDKYCWNTYICLK